VTELWEGTLSVGPGIKLRLLLHLTTASDGSLHATCDSLDQGAIGIPVETVTRDKTTLAFAMTSVGAEYSGKLNDTQTSAAGVFKQRGGELALTMAKTDKGSTLARPQTPKPSFPYRSEDVTYANAAASVTLAGTLTTPNGEGPFPAVILITGSGPQDRDETLFEHKPFLVIADDLTKQGIAVLRVDDRGVGGSTGSTTTSTSKDLAGDVLAGIAFLKGRKEIDPARIGLIGHSEGGLIAPIVATQSKDVAFVVMLAGPGLPGIDILLLQGGLLARAAGALEDQIAQGQAVNKRLYTALASAKDDKDAETKVRAILEDPASNPGASRKPADDDAIVAQIVNPWFRYFVKYDPRPTLKKMMCPVLALAGEKDMQVPPEQDLAAIKKANPRIVTKELPGLNHLFQTAKTGAPMEYAAIEETFSPAALAEISAFVLEKTRKK
jgi:pimeloyl-ACP methyl ester carboxylesterase